MYVCLLYYAADFTDSWFHDRDLVNYAFPYALHLVKCALRLVTYALDLDNHPFHLVSYALDLVNYSLYLANYALDFIMPQSSH